MSHIVTIRTQVREHVVIAQACERLRLPPPLAGTHRLFTNQATGLAVRLEGWRYPLVCETERAELHFDHFDGRWGNPARLDAFVQAYAVVATQIAARKQGYSVSEQPLADGSIKLTVAVTGGAA